jgi:hypothetical protein
MPFDELEYRKQYRKDNKERITEVKKAWYKRNKERVLAKNKKYAQDNREKNNQYKADWKKRNREQHLAQGKEYKKANKDKYSAYEAKRRALKFRATIRLTELDKFVISEMYNLAQLRTEQTGFQWHVDHIVPLTKGGLHKPTNLQVVPGSWNESKGNRNCDVYNRAI